MLPVPSPTKFGINRREGLSCSVYSGLWRVSRNLSFLLNEHLDCAHLHLGFPVLPTPLKGQSTRELPGMPCLESRGMLAEKASTGIQEVSATATARLRHGLGFLARAGAGWKEQHLAQDSTKPLSEVCKSPTGRDPGFPSGKTAMLRPHFKPPQSETRPNS